MGEVLERRRLQAECATGTRRAAHTYQGIEMYPENSTASDRGPPEDHLQVIVADDDPLERSLLKRTLQAAGIVVIAEASDGRQAVELTLGCLPDVVLMDVMMPGVDGITASRRVTAKRPAQRVVLLTDSADARSGVDTIAVPNSRRFTARGGVRRTGSSYALGGMLCQCHRPARRAQAEIHTRA
jgi:CheY-like chemotaxis protein